MGNLVPDRLRRNSGWRDERFQCITDPALLSEAASLIEELVGALEPFARVAQWAEDNGHDLAADFDMLLRGPGEKIAGHLHAQANDFIRARAAIAKVRRGE
jgi:hypothetical protein